MGFRVCSVGRALKREHAYLIYFHSCHAPSAPSSLRKLEDARAQIESELHQAASVEQLSEKTGFSCGEVRELTVAGIVRPEDIITSRGIVNQIYVDDRVKDYIVDIVWASRQPAAHGLKLDGMIRYGASPRATIYLTLAAKAHAFLNGRGYVTPQDVKSVGPDVLRHRIAVSYEAEAEEMTSEQIVEQIFAGLPVP